MNKNLFKVLVAEQAKNEELREKMNENVRSSWENFDNWMSSRIRRTSMEPEEEETLLQEFFILSYVDVVGERCNRDPMWILALHQFIEANFLRHMTRLIGEKLNKAQIPEEVWDVALAHDPDVIRIYLWAVNGEVDDEAIKTLENEGNLDSFVAAFTDMVKHIKTKLQSSKSTDSQRELCEKYIRCLYEAWNYGVMEDVLARWDKEMLETIKEESISFLEANYVE